MGTSSDFRPGDSPLDPFPGLLWSGVPGSDQVVPWFDVVIRPERSVIRLETRGELDLAAGPSLRTEVSELIRAGFTQLVIDLRHLSFIDLSGIRLLHDLVGEARAGGWQLSLIRGRPGIQRVLGLADELGTLPFIDV